MRFTAAILAITTLILLPSCVGPEQPSDTPAASEQPSPLVSPAAPDSSPSTAQSPTCIAPISYPTATPTSEITWAGYDSDPDHLWNRLFRGLLRRVTADGREYGSDALDPLLWNDTTHLLSGPSHDEAMEALDEFLSSSGEEQIRDPTRRALFQRDLWSVFDWLTVRSDTFREQRQALKSRLAAAIRALALADNEVQTLPDNYGAAIEAGRYPPSHSGCYLSPTFLPPGLTDASGDWISLGRHGGPVAISHVQDAHFLGRSAFLVYVRVPGGREATLRFVEQMTARTAHDVPVGTEVALVRRMLLVDDKGEIVATPIVEEVEIRHFNFSLPGSQDFYKFVLDRNALFSGLAGGLRAAEREFPLFRSHEIDEFELKAGPAARVPASCMACHSHPSLANSAAQSILSYSRALFPAPDGQSTAVEMTSPEAESQAVVDWKVQQPSWKELQTFWNR